MDKYLVGLIDGLGHETLAAHHKVAHQDPTSGPPNLSFVEHIARERPGNPSFELCIKTGALRVAVRGL
jgi:hypothetical protein